MAGALTISTLNNDTGVLATQNGMTGIAKAWVNFNGTGTVAIRGSFNVSSITDNGTGDYTVNLTNALSDTNWAVNVTVQNQGTAPHGFLYDTGNPITSTSAVRIQVQRSGVGPTDNGYVMVSVFSS